MKVTAAVSRAPKAPFILEELDLDEPRDDEILVRMVGVGICHTDLFVRDLGITSQGVFGHEGSGVVEKVGSHITKVEPGDHVVLTYASCGICGACQSGKMAYCMDFKALNNAGCRMDGSTTLTKDGESVMSSFFGQSSFATYALTAERNVIVVEKDVPLEILGPLGCGFMTGAGSVITSLNPQAGESIAIFGTGAVGITAVMGAAISGCANIFAVDINPERLKIAEEMGATMTINANDVDPVETIKDTMGLKDGVDYSLDCVGSPAVLRQAFECLVPAGTCGLVGVAPPFTDVSLDMTLLLSGRQVRGMVEGDSIPDVFIPQLIDLYKQGRFPFDRLIKTYPFKDFNQAVEDAESGCVIKSIVTF